jgi:hypothetical protein
MPKILPNVLVEIILTYVSYPTLEEWFKNNDTIWKDVMKNSKKMKFFDQEENNILIGSPNYIEMRKIRKSNQYDFVALSNFVNVIDKFSNIYLSNNLSACLRSKKTRFEIPLKNTYTIKMDWNRYKISVKTMEQIIRDDKTTSKWCIISRNDTKFKPKYDILIRKLLMELL